MINVATWHSARFRKRGKNQINHCSRLLIRYIQSHFTPVRLMSSIRNPSLPPSCTAHSMISSELRNSVLGKTILLSGATNFQLGSSKVYKK